MAQSICENCGNFYIWDWEEAFDPMGFAEGTSQVETWTVANFLSGKGFKVVTECSFLQTVITSVMKDDVLMLSPDFYPERSSVRYRLAEEVVSLLDSQFSHER